MDTTIPPLAATSHLDRCAGALVGLACGDAVGTTAEFRARGSFPLLHDMVGGGPFRLAPGLWTDDTSMALCLADSLLAKDGFDAKDQMDRYVRWWRQGERSATGTCFDIGLTVRKALMRYESNQEAFAGDVAPNTAGNGALMRLAPVVLFYFPDTASAHRHAIDATRTTHAAPEAIDCTRLMTHVLLQGLAGASKVAMLNADSLALSTPKVSDLARGTYLKKKVSDVAGTGYCVASLEAALWCFNETETFESAVLLAANLGDDADTTAAIVGQIAGAHYGVHAIPQAWRQKLHLGAEIEAIGRRLGQAAAFA